MNTKEYNNYVERWEKYWKREKEYYEKRMEYIRDEKEYLLPALDERYGQGRFDSPYQFGPFTIIRDQADLMNHKYFGKKLWSDLEKCEGEVIGYAYDAYDDYIQIRLDTGEIRNIIVNSHYRVEE